MAKAILTAKPGSGYDDVIEEKYQFPRTYLNAIQQAVGDFVVYYEPRRGGGELSYFAVARIVGIDPVPSNSDLFYARIADYLDFDKKVPFRIEGNYFESILRRGDGETNRGAFGRAVRLLPEVEFDAILAAGFSENFDWPGHDAITNTYPLHGLAEEQIPFERDIRTSTIDRKFRDRVFARKIQTAYDRRCAVTGLQILNGGGRPEVQAAHIQPVAANGPDSIRNGLALSGTVHWMFDRGLISVDDDYRIVKAKGAIPKELQSLFQRDQIALPSDERFWPHRHFLQYHRENVFKG